MHFAIDHSSAPMAPPTVRPNPDRRKRTRALLTLAGLMFLAPGLAGAQVLPPNPDPTCIVPSSEFSSWFDSGSPSLNGPVKEADSVNLDTSNNCNFYKWSAQMFLWLTSPATGPYQGNRVLDSQIFYQVNNGQMVPQIGGAPLNLAVRSAQAGPDGLPVVIDAKGNLREFVPAPADTTRRLMVVASAKGAPVGLAKAQRGKDGKAEFLDTTGKKLDLVPHITADMIPDAALTRVTLPAPKAGPALLTTTSRKQAIAQKLNDQQVLIRFGEGSSAIFVPAGSTTIENLGPGQAGGDGVLLAQNGSMIFYETIVNDVYAWYTTGRMVPGGIAPLYVKNNPSTYGYFPTTAADLASVLKFASAYAGLPPSAFPDANALAIEAKLSWVDVTSLPNPGSYITAQAMIPVYDRSTSSNWKLIGTRPATVALVGAHIVGSAAGHPEMIWATYEHQANAPLAGYQYTSGGKTVSVPQNTAGQWLLAANGASAPFNAETGHWDSTTQSIVQTTPPTPIGPTNTLREKAWGSASDGQPNQEDKTAADANTQIISINTNVLGQLAAAGASADPRASYLLIGATWTFGGASPNGQYPANPGVYNEIGTSMLANSTMETYQQGADTRFSTGTNCFSCHSDYTSTGTKASVAVSHIFGGLTPLPGMSLKTSQ